MSHSIVFACLLTTPIKPYLNIAYFLHWPWFLYSQKSHYLGRKHIIKLFQVSDNILKYVHMHFYFLYFSFAITTYFAILCGTERCLCELFINVQFSILDCHSYRCMQRTAVIHAFWSSKTICQNTMAPGPHLKAPMVRDRILNVYQSPLYSLTKSKNAFMWISQLYYYYGQQYVYTYFTWTQIKVLIFFPPLVTFYTDVCVSDEAVNSSFIML